MHVTRDNGLGFWSELLTAAIGAGSKVYETKQNVKLQTAQMQQQIALQKQQLDNDRRAAELQAKLIASQQASPVPLQPVQTPQGVQYVPAPAGGYDVQLERDALPSWVIPAAIGGGVLLLVLLLRR